MSSLEAINIDEVLSCLKRATSTARNEEDLRVRASSCIEEKVLKPLGLEDLGRYEYTFLSGGRADALYGHIIIEYKAPGRLVSQADIAGAKEQVVRYIIGLAGSPEKYKDYLGIIISDKIAFVRYSPQKRRWVLRGPYDISRNTVIKLVEALRGLRRKRLGVEELLADFGVHPRTKKLSPLSVKTVRTLYKKLSTTDNERVKILFEDWKRLFMQTTAYDPEKLQGLEKQYGFPEGDPVEYDYLLFAIQTYYALIMKLLAAEITYLYGARGWLKSYVAELEDAYLRGLEELRRVLGELEDGGIFKRLLGITNFIEGDYFSWYLDVLDEELADVIAEIARKLADYEPATPQLEPEATRDLLKRLYQHLVPKEIRRSLGEYYTPDWLAELVLDETGLTEEYFEELASHDPLAPFRVRVLDPASGSGTFLVMLIKRLRSYAENHFMLDIMGDYVLRNIVGYDLNPLAVLAARTNYLLALADVLPPSGEKEIPVYLADSIMVESRTAIYGSYYILRTTVGTFEIPRELVDDGLLGELLSLIEQGLRNMYSPEEFLERFDSKILSRYSDPSRIDRDAVARLYRTFLELERAGKNHVWIAIIRNAFAPLLKGKFDFVVGNPPWINWENLPEAYRKVSAELWRRYGLVPGRKRGPAIGESKRDISMLFTIRSIDLYLKERGRLGFLITYTVFVSKAGEGFRRFFAYGRNGVEAKIVKVHDLEELQPFEGAQNRTAILIAEKGGKTEFPIPAVLWKGSRRQIPPEYDLEEVLGITSRISLYMVPINPRDPGSQWIEVLDTSIIDIINRIVGRGGYRAHAGVNTGGLNNVYFVRVVERRGRLVLVENLDTGRKKVKKVRMLVEEDLVYPLIKGANLERWTHTLPGIHIILPVDGEGRILDYETMKEEYPHAWEYFLTFFDDLINRGGQPYKSALEVYRRLRAEGKSIYEVLEAARGRAPPFYYIFNIEGSLAPFKVAWKEVSSRLSRYKFNVALVGPHESGKPVVPDHTVLYIPFEDEDEAYYVAGVLNSSIIRLVSHYMVASNIQDLNIPRFDRQDRVHVEIARLARRAREAAVEGRQGEVMEVEDLIDREVAKLFGISGRELGLVRRMLEIVAG